MNKTTSFAIALLLGLPLWAGITVEDSTLKLAIDSGSVSVTDEDLSGLPSFTKVLKTGDGTAILAADSLKGKALSFEITEGTLGATSLAYFGKASGQTLTVGTGATLDLTSTDNGKYSFASFGLSLAGTIKRGGANVSGSALGAFFLTDDTDFVMEKSFNVWGAKSDLPLNGHTLTKTGSGTLTFSGGAMSDGTLKVTEGPLTLGLGSVPFSYQGGTLDFSGSQLNMDATSYDPASTSALRFHDATKVVLSSNYGTRPDGDPRTVYNRWSGPVTVTAPLELQLKQDYSFVTFAGAFTNTAEITSTTANIGTLVLSGEAPKSIQENITLKKGGLEFRDSKTVEIAASKVISLSSGSSVLFEDAGEVTTLGTEQPFSVTGSSRVRISGRTVLSDRDSHFGNTSGYGVFDILDGAVVSNRMMIGENGTALVTVSNAEWRIGNASGSVVKSGRPGIGWSYCGDVELGEGGVFNVNDGASGLTLGRNAGAYGIVAMAGGTWLSKGLSVGDSGRGLWHQTGGTANVYGNMTVNSGATSDAGGSQISVAGPTAVLNLKDSSFYGCASSAASTAILNLSSGGTLKAGSIVRGSASSEAAEGSRLYVNCNGGVYCPLSCWQAFGTGGSDSRGVAEKLPDAVTVFSKGMVVDTTWAVNGGGAAVSPVFLETPILAPTGKGVRSIAVPESLVNETYTFRPEVFIEGDGFGASAVAEIDANTLRLTGITVTSPGCDYTEANTRVYVGTNVFDKVAATRRTKAVECTFELAENDKSGGLVKRGGVDNTLELNAVNTYRGVTSCEAGKLEFVCVEAHPDGTGLRVARDASIVFPVDTKEVSVGSLAGCGVIRANNNTSGLVLSGVTNVMVCAAEIFADGATSLTVNGAVSSANRLVVTVSGLKEYCSELGVDVRTFAETMARKDLLVAMGGLTNGSTVELVPHFEGLTDEEAACFRLRKNGNKIVLLGLPAGLMLIFR